MPIDSQIHRIGVDGNEANTSNRVGSNVYAFEILHELEKQTRNNSDVEWQIYLSSEPVKDMPPKRKGWKYILVRPSAFATQWGLPIRLWKDRKKLDVFFTPGHYAPRACPIPYVSSVMDLAYLKFPTQFKLRDLYQLKNWTAYSIRKAKHIIAISESTKKDVVNTYRIPENKITVAYPALLPNRSTSVPDQKKVLKKFGLKKPFLLYVGTLQPRKNLTRLIKAFEGLADEFSEKQNGEFEIDLVIAGKIGWLADDIVRKAKNSRYASNIHLLGYVNDEEKAVLYQKTLATVLVGLYEGFGMPPLEALAYGKRSVVSNNSSLPEVVGKTGILVDPHSVPSITEGLKKAIKMYQKDSTNWNKLAKEQLKKFSWEKSAGKILTALMNIKHENNRV